MHGKERLQLAQSWHRHHRHHSADTVEETLTFIADILQRTELTARSTQFWIGQARVNSATLEPQIADIL
jgi:hypothetical protein